jgi:hypothetical protein
MTLEDSINYFVRNSMYINVRNSVWDFVAASTQETVWDSVRDSAYRIAFNSIHISVHGSIWRAIRGNVRVCLDQKINKQL